MATDAQKAQISSSLSKLSADGGSLLKTASASQLSSLKSTLSKISSALGSSSSSGGGGGITSDSKDATRTETSIGRDIESIASRAGIGDEPDTSELEALRRAQEREIERQRKLLEQRRATAVAGIEEGFAVERTATETQQKRETGQTSMDIARMGGYLGVAASRQGVMQNLVIAQRAELRALESAKQDAINTANQAYEDRDFELAQEKLKSAREIESEIFNRRNTFFNQQMDMLGEERAQMQNQREATQFLRDQANDRLDRILEAGVLPEYEDLVEIAGGLDISVDEANKIVKAAQKAKDLAEKDQRTDREIAILNTLRGIPRDQTVVIDGVTYRGLAELSSSGRVSATEARAQREAQQKAEFAQDLQGWWGGRDDNEILRIPIEEAITNYPDLDPDYIESMYKILEDSENRTQIASKVAAGDWDVAMVDYPGDSKGPQEVVYDKNSYEAAIKGWAQSTGPGTDTSWYTAGEYRGDDEEKAKKEVQVVIDGQIYTGQGVYNYDTDKYEAPFQPQDFQVNQY